MRGVPSLFLPLLAAGLGLLPAGCATAPPPEAAYAPDAARIAVRLKPRERLGVRGPDRIRVSPAKGEEGGRLRTPIRVRLERGAFVLRGSHRAKSVRAKTVRIAAEPRAERIRLDEASYHGTLRLRRRDDGTFDVINDVPRRAYIAGVLAREMPTGWPQAAYRAQAIAARSWALWRKRARQGRPWHVRAGTAGQAYRGGDPARAFERAARATEGQVLVWQERVLPAFYSSTCGGTGQDGRAVAAGLARDPPLRGRRHRPYCRDSKWYRWGPLHRPVARLRRRLAAWARTQDHSLRRLRRLKGIRVAERNDAGRPAAFAVRGAGRRHRVRAVSFRAACNFQGEGAPPLSEKQRLRSSHVRAQVEGERVRFHDGRGYGHGVGLCQWGARGMARRGFEPRQILAYYYPEAGLARLADGGS
jgi:stage II sporulation protein D